MNVLLAADGQAPARAAARLLEKLGDREALDVTVLTVTTYDLIVPERPISIVAPMRQRRESSRACLDHAVDELRQAGFRVHGLLAEGTPSDRILGYIEGEDIELTLLGGGHRTWLGGALLGSTSSYVLHHSPTATLVVHEVPPDKKPAHALFATDGSEGTSQELETFCNFADPERCVVEVTTVARDEPRLAYPVSMPYPMIEVPVETRIEAQKIEAARAVAERAQRELARSGFRAQADAFIGDPASVIVDIARNGRFDLVVTGSRSVGWVRRLMGFSVSDPVARRTPAAMVVPKAPVAERVLVPHLRSSSI